MNNTVLERGGTVILPCFSFSRTQELLTTLYEIYGNCNNFNSPVLVDSKLSCDISEKALNIAKQNAKKLNIQNIEFIHSDLFQNISKEQRFDLIISNPPYIPKGTDLCKNFPIRKIK